MKAQVPNFKIGDKVLLKQDKTPLGQSAKLINKRDGPYLIQGKGPNFTYKIRHLGTGKVHKSLVNAARLTLYNQRQTEADITNEQSSGVANDSTDSEPHEQNNHSHLITGSEPNETRPTSAEPFDNSQGHRCLTSIKIIGASRKSGVQRFRVQYIMMITGNGSTKTNYQALPFMTTCKSLTGQVENANVKKTKDFSSKVSSCWLIPSLAFVVELSYLVPISIFPMSISTKCLFLSLATLLL